jgi:hypothetical protein
MDQELEQTPGVSNCGCALHKLFELHPTLDEANAIFVPLR